jgi:hypothetical protein
MPPSREERQLSDLEKQKDRMYDNAVELGMFLGKGVLLANGAALLACYTALTNARICDTETFALLVWLFAAGFVIGLVGIAISYYSSERVARLTGRMIKHAADLAVASAADTDLKAAANAALAELNEDLKGIVAFWPGVVQYLHIAGGVAFLVGTVAPLISPAIMNSLCGA